MPDIETLRQVLKTGGQPVIVEKISEAQGNRVMATLGGVGITFDLYHDNKVAQIIFNVNTGQFAVWVQGDSAAAADRIQGSTFLPIPESLAPRMTATIIAMMIAQFQKVLTLTYDEFLENVVTPEVASLLGAKKAQAGGNTVILWDWVLELLGESIPIVGGILADKPAADAEDPIRTVYNLIRELVEEGLLSGAQPLPHQSASGATKAFDDPAVGALSQSGRYVATRFAGNRGPIVTDAMISLREAVLGAEDADPESMSGMFATDPRNIFGGGQDTVPALHEILEQADQAAVGMVPFDDPDIAARVAKTVAGNSGAGNPTINGAMAGVFSSMSINSRGQSAQANIKLATSDFNVLLRKMSAAMGISTVKVRTA